MRACPACHCEHTHGKAARLRPTSPNGPTVLAGAKDSACAHLHPLQDLIDFLIGEVKGGRRSPDCNVKFRERHDAVAKALNGFSAFPEEKTADLIFGLWRCSALSCANQTYLDGADLTRDAKRTAPTTYGDHMLRISWACFRPTAWYDKCVVDCSRELWGHQFDALVVNALFAYFKRLETLTPGHGRGLLHRHLRAFLAWTHRCGGLVLPLSVILRSGAPLSSGAPDRRRTSWEGARRRALPTFKLRGHPWGASRSDACPTYGLP